MVYMVNVLAGQNWVVDWKTKVFTYTWVIETNTPNITALSVPPNGSVVVFLDNNTLNYYNPNVKKCREGFCADFLWSKNLSKYGELKSAIVNNYGFVLAGVINYTGGMHIILFVFDPNGYQIAKIKVPEHSITISCPIFQYGFLGGEIFVVTPHNLTIYTINGKVVKRIKFPNPLEMYLYDTGAVACDNGNILIITSNGTLAYARPTGLSYYFNSSMRLFKISRNDISKYCQVYKVNFSSEDFYFDQGYITVSENRIDYRSRVGCNLATEFFGNMDQEPLFTTFIDGYKISYILDAEKSGLWDIDVYIRNTSSGKLVKVIKGLFSNISLVKPMHCYYIIRNYSIVLTCIYHIDPETRVTQYTKLWETWIPVSNKQSCKSNSNVPTTSKQNFKNNPTNPESSPNPRSATGTKSSSQSKEIIIVSQNKNPRNNWLWILILICVILVLFLILRRRK